jgi:hypothetical protein
MMEKSLDLSSSGFESVLQPLIPLFLFPLQKDGDNTNLREWLLDIVIEPEG